MVAQSKRNSSILWLKHCMLIISMKSAIAIMLLQQSQIKKRDFKLVCNLGFKNGM